MGAWLCLGGRLSLGCPTITREPEQALREVIQNTSPQIEVTRVSWRLKRGLFEDLKSQMSTHGEQEQNGSAGPEAR